MDLLLGAEIPGLQTPGAAGSQHRAGDGWSGSA